MITQEKYKDDVGFSIQLQAELDNSYRELSEFSILKHDAIIKELEKKIADICRGKISNDFRFNFKNWEVYIKKDHCNCCVPLIVSVKLLEPIKKKYAFYVDNVHKITFFNSSKNLDQLIDHFEILVKDNLEMTNFRCAYKLVEFLPRVDPLDEGFIEGDTISEIIMQIRWKHFRP